MAKNKQQAKIEELGAELQKLGEARRLRGEQIATLEAEQREHIVAARVHKSVQAQSNVDRLSGEISKLRTDDVWDSDAIEQISAQLAEAKAALRREQWQARCENVNRLVTKRSKGELEQRLLDQALQLRQTAVELDESDDEIVSALRALHPSLARDVQEFPYRARWRSSALAWLLRDVAQIPIVREPMYITRMQELAVDAFDLVRRHIDEAAEMEPEGKPA